ncbi:hypothetical protein [Sphingobacterium deserti]|uniref:Lipoprotein n=1 Tax=Sphingobacterium deserti TaxID=1229276 RepID=A0A0B8SZ24_9SPHI|nr:hypothetical protein [Sphingobacterium deserti]KGE12812.1 hypothetical protein DI53_3406 [Sphingobacterium deserti]
MMSWRSLFISFILILILSACSKESIPTDANEEVPVNPLPQKYEIVNIEFNGAAASVEEFVQVRPNTTYNNNTDIILTVNMDQAPLYERSTFVPNDREQYTLVDSAKLFRVPLQIHDAVISFGEEKWKYAKGETTLETRLNFKELIEIAPRQRVIIAQSVIFTKIKMPYILTIKNVETESLVRIEGVWTGVYPLKAKTSIDASDL